MSKVIAGLMAGLLLCTLTLAYSSPAAAIDNGGIGGKPANPRADNPRTQSIFVYELKPGAKADDAVKVINNSDKRKTLLIYAVDSQVASDGAFACAQKTDAPVSVGTWIKLSKDRVTLEPNASEDVPFTIAVPQTASAGEQNGCVVIQDSEQRPSPQGNGVTLSFRSAIRVAVTVPGKITKELDFTGPVAIRATDDKVYMAVGLKNNGNVSLDTEVKAQVAHVLGGVAGSGGGTFPVLARSQAGFNFETEKPFWGGWHKVSATATYGSDASRSLGESGDRTTITSAAKWIFIKPAPLALAIELAALTVIVAAIVWLLLRRHRYRRMHATSRIHHVGQGESLQSVAKTYGVSWKTIAKLNNVKPPYHLEAGQRLKVPVKEGPATTHDKQAEEE